MDLKEAIKRLTGGRGVDVIYDPVGGKYAEPAVRSMAMKGRYLVVGFAAGDIPKFPLNLILHGDINIHKHVILGLGLAPTVNLLDTKRHPPCDRLPNATAHTVEAGLSHEPSY